MIEASRPQGGPQIRLAEQSAKETREFPRFLDYQDDVLSAVSGAIEGDLAQALTIADKQERENRLDELKATTHAQLDEQFCSWQRSGNAGECRPADLNRSAFIAWIDCQL